MVKRKNDRFLHLFDVFPRTTYQDFEVQDRVADNLARPVVSDITSPVGAAKACIFRLKLDHVQKQIAFRTTFPKGVNMRVLAENQVVIGFSKSRLLLSDDMVKQTFLKIPCSAVFNEAEVGEGGSMFQGYRITELQNYRVQKFKSSMRCARSKVQWFKVTELQSFRITK